MNAYAGPYDDLSRHVEEWMENASAELRGAVAYVDHVIVPEVRRETAGAARLLATHLNRLAEKLDPQSAPEGRQNL